jgi:hypothetical protein
MDWCEAHSVLHAPCQFIFCVTIMPCATSACAGYDFDGTNFKVSAVCAFINMAMNMGSIAVSHFECACARGCATADCGAWKPTKVCSCESGCMCANFFPRDLRGKDTYNDFLAVGVTPKGSAGKCHVMDAYDPEPRLPRARHTAHGWLCGPKLRTGLRTAATAHRAGVEVCSVHVNSKDVTGSDNGSMRAAQDVPHKLCAECASPTLRLLICETAVAHCSRGSDVISTICSRLCQIWQLYHDSMINCACCATFTESNRWGSWQLFYS